MHESLVSSKFRLWKHQALARDGNILYRLTRPRHTSAGCHLDSTFSASLLYNAGSAYKQDHRQCQHHLHASVPVRSFNPAENVIKEGLLRRYS
jgi:hypothetical protein